MAKNKQQKEKTFSRDPQPSCSLFSFARLFFAWNLFSVLCSFFLFGCYKPTPPITQLTDAHKKFEQTCREDFLITPVITSLPDTLYIYIPVRFDILRTKASQQMLVKTDPSLKRQVNFVETDFADQEIAVRYDITEVMTYPKSLGYSSTYTEEFSRLHNNVLGALSRSFGDLDEDQRPMDFVVLSIVDVRNGIGIKNTFHFMDLKKAMAQALPQDEYARRYLSEMIGDQNLIGNTTGRGLERTDLTWPEFLAKQITYRINFKYNRSAFPPTDSDVNEIMRIVHDTLSAYDYTDVSTITLKDLASGETYRFDYSQLETFGEE